MRSARVRLGVVPSVLVFSTLIGGGSALAQQPLPPPPPPAAPAPAPAGAPNPGLAPPPSHPAPVAPPPPAFAPPAPPAAAPWQPYGAYPPPYGAYPPGYAPPAYYPPGYAPPAYYPPPGMPYDYPPLLPPPTLAYEDGQTVPYGYRVRARPNRAVVIAGSVAFGSTYLTSVLTAGTVLAGGYDAGKPYAPLFAPGVGPFIAIGTLRGGAGTPLLVLDGLAQLGGLAMLISGVAIEERYLQRVAGGEASPLEVLAHPDVVVGPRSAALRFAM